MRMHCFRLVIMITPIIYELCVNLLTIFLKMTRVMDGKGLSKLYIDLSPGQPASTRSFVATGSETAGRLIN